MTAPALTVIRGPVPASVDDARGLLRRLVDTGAVAREAASRGDRARPRTWAVLGELTCRAGLGDDERAVEHDRIGRLAVRLAVDKTLCVGTSRSVRALHQGAVMEGSWGEEARVVASVAEARVLLGEGDWRPSGGDVILIAAESVEVSATVDTWAAEHGLAVEQAAIDEEIDQ